MDLNQLRYFQKVARTQSVTRAAQELYVSQPTLSQSLSRLESSLGVPLFIHQAGKPLQLNDAGRAFLERVDAAFASLEEGVNVAREMHTKSVQVSIASSIHNLCDELVVDYYGLHPEVSISQRLVQINSLTALLLNDEVDFTISPCPLPDPRLECLPMFTEEFMIAVGPGHQLYGADSVSLDELRHERFVCNYTEADRNLLERIFGEDCDLDIMLESDEPAVVRRVVSTGLGVSFSPVRLIMRQYSDERLGHNWFVRISDPLPVPPTCITKKKGRYLLRTADDFFHYTLSYCETESRQVADFLKNFEQIQREKRQFDRYLAK